MDPLSSNLRSFLCVLASLLVCRTQDVDVVDISGGDADNSNGFRCRPQKVRLALTEESCIRVSWSTHASGCKSSVLFGKSQTAVQGNNSFPTFEFETDTVDSDTYGPEDFCAEPATSDIFSPPNLHTTVLRDLEPGERYSYQIGHHRDIRQFKAPPKVGPQNKFKIIVVGDMGESVHSEAKSPGAKLTAGQIAGEVLNGGAELVIHVGDLSYADGVHKIWDAFLDEIEPFASRAPYHIAVGNHEYDWKTGEEKKHHRHPEDASGRDKAYEPDWGNFGNDSGGECGVTVAKLFVMPGRQIGGRLESEDRLHHPNPPFWFSYDYGSVHFVTISTEHDLTKGSHQLKWLRQDLEMVDRCLTPWVVLLSHRPMYVVFPHKSNRIVAEHLRESLEALVDEFHVDVVLSGHVHSYYRTCNVFDERCIDPEDGGSVHVTLGCGGHKLSEVEHKQPEWLAYAEREYGFGRMTVDGGRELLLEFVHSKSGKVQDYVTLRPSRSATRLCSGFANPIPPT